MTSARQSVTIHTDGACSGNPGPGGWGAILCVETSSGVHEKELSGGDKPTTNNRMELMAVIAGLEALTRPCAVTVRSDSKYVLDGISGWIHGWKKRGWKKADGKPVINADLWQRLDQAQARHSMTWEWVKGHAGDVMNERADALARSAITAMHQQSV